jgi:hypothetical protein
MWNTFIALTLILAGIPSISYAGLFGPSNYAECILKHMPSTTTQQEAVVARKICLDDFPNEYTGVKKADSFFGNMTRIECYQKYLRALNSPGAKLEIRRACNVLYK